MSHLLARPEPGADTVHVRRPDRVVALGVVIVAVATAVRVWLMDRTWFHLDDLVLTNTAAREPLSLDQLTEPYFGHLMPGDGCWPGWPCRATPTTTRGHGSSWPS